MKKIIAILLAICCIASLAACTAKETRAGFTFTVPSEMTLFDESEDYPDYFVVGFNEGLNTKFIGFEVFDDVEKVEESLKMYAKFIGEENYETFNDKVFGSLSFKGFYSEIMKKAYMYTRTENKILYVEVTGLTLDDKNVVELLSSMTEKK